MVNEVIGIDIKESPRFYKSLDRLMTIYRFKKIFVDPDGWAYRVNLINLQARTLYKKDGKIKFGKTLITTRSTIEFFETRLSDDELDSLISHEFEHLKNFDDIRTIFPFILILIMSIIFYLYVWSSLLVTIAVSILILSILLPVLLIACSIHRRCELRADRESVFRIKNPDALKSALNKFNDGAVKAVKHQRKIDNMTLNHKIVKKLMTLGYPPLELRLKRIDDYKEQIEDDSA